LETEKKAGEMHISALGANTVGIYDGLAGSGGKLV